MGGYIDITGDFEDLPKGTLLYSPLFECEEGTMYNCSLFRVVPGECITIVRNGIKYTLDYRGTLDGSGQRQIFFDKTKGKSR